MFETCSLAFRGRTAAWSLLGISVLVSAPAFAAETGVREKFSELMGSGWAVLLLVIGALILFGFLIEAFFIHIAAGFMNLRGSFGTAIKASILTWLIGIGMSLLGLALAQVLSAEAAGLVNLGLSAAGGGMAIAYAYDTGFVTGLVTWFVSGILTILALILLVFLAVALLSKAGTAGPSMVPWL